jgi:GntR family transcriptional regulator
MTLTDADRYLEEPLLTSPGQPLRVAVYSRLAQGIRSGTFLSGSPLPRETELGVALGVSRTVVREALMLLEEDGLIVTKRGIGRFVTDSIPHPVMDEFQPLEHLLAEPGTTLAIALVEFTMQKVTDFVSENLVLDDQADFWFHEAIATRDGQPVALIQEYMPDEQRLATLNPAVAKQLRDAAADPSTLLQALTARVGPVFSAGACRIAATVAGPTRAAQLDIKASDPLLVLTQTASLDGVPAYVSKCALPPAFGHLAVAQWQTAYPR